MAQQDKAIWRSQEPTFEWADQIYYEHSRLDPMEHEEGWFSLDAYLSPIISVEDKMDEGVIDLANSMPDLGQQAEQLALSRPLCSSEERIMELDGGLPIL